MDDDYVQISKVELQQYVLIIGHLLELQGGQVTVEREAMIRTMKDYSIGLRHSATTITVALMSNARAAELMEQLSEHETDRLDLDT